MKNQSIYKRVYKEKYKTKFRNKLINTNFSQVLYESDVDNALEIFDSIFTTIYDECFPKKQINITKSKVEKPWITKEIYEAQKHKNSLYTTFLKQPTETNDLKYRKARNKFINSAKKAKRDYISNKIKSSDPKNNGKY